MVKAAYLFFTHKFLKSVEFLLQCISRRTKSNFASTERPNRPPSMTYQADVHYIYQEFISNSHMSSRVSGVKSENSPRAFKRLKITGEHTKITLKPNSVMAVVPRHLPSKQICSDCLIKPAALSAIHTCFLPAKYSIIHVKGLEKQENKEQSDLYL